MSILTIQGQLATPLKQGLLIGIIVILLGPLTVSAGSKDDPLLTMLMADQLEFRRNLSPSAPNQEQNSHNNHHSNNQQNNHHNERDAFLLEGQAWIGKDLTKLWLKTELEIVDGKTEEVELQALYSRAYAPNWDIQFGLRQDYQLINEGLNSNQLTWAALGLQGLSPYFFEVDAAIFIGENGRSALRLEAEYELIFTQQLILSPEIEINFYGKNDAAIGIGSGLSDVELGLRLRYEITREFAPYIGINWSSKIGKSADYSRADGENVANTHWVVGLRAWF